MDDNKEKPSGGVKMAKYFDRDMKVAYVEQINTGKMTVTEAANAQTFAKKPRFLAKRKRG